MNAQRLVGDGETGELEKQLEQMLATGLAAAQKNAASPELSVVKPLTEDVAPSAFRCWTVSAEATTHGIFFGQAIIQYPQGILFITYEAPFISGASELFHNMLGMIHKI